MHVSPPPQGIINGAALTPAVPAIVRVVGPANYAAGGFSVDCSAFFSSILAVAPARAFTTATKAAAIAQCFMPCEAGTDLYASAKFRCILQDVPTPTGAVAAPVFTGNTTATSAPVAGAVCIATCNQNHPSLAALTHLPTGTNTAPAFTGNNVDLTEPGAIALAAFTYEFIVYGVPK